MSVTVLVRHAIAALVALPLAAHAQQPEAIMVQGETMVATIHAQGAQVYECKADASGALGWRFREPVATLLSNGKTLGRHYAGPTWELADGSAIVAKVAASAPGAGRDGHSAAQARGRIAQGERPACGRRRRFSG